MLSSHVRSNINMFFNFVTTKSDVNEYLIGIFIFQWVNGIRNL